MKAEKTMVLLPEWFLKGKSYQGDRIMGDLIIQKGKVWYADCTYRGIRLRDSLKTEDRQVAIERLLELQLLVREGRYQIHKIFFEKLAEQYDPQVDRENKLMNLKNHVLPAFKGKRLSEIDAQAWAEEIAETNPQSTALHIIRPARELGLSINYKKLNFKKGKEFDGSQIVSVEIAEKVLDILKNAPRGGNKYYPICAIAMYSTLPSSDIIHLRKKDVEFNGENAGITYIRRKTRYKKKPALFVPMTEKLRWAFSLVPTPLDPDATWFPFYNTEAITGTVSRAFKKAGWIHGGAMHQFRHFGACYLINQGVPLTTIQELLGHSDFNTTLKYARTNRERLKEGVKSFDKLVTKTGGQ